MYELPVLYDTRSYLCKLTQAQLDEQKDECEFRSLVICDSDVYDLCCCLLKRLNLTYPTSPTEAVSTYMALKEELNRLL